MVVTTFAPGAEQPVLGQHCPYAEECPWLFKPRGWAATWAKETCEELSWGSMTLSPMGASQSPMTTSPRPYSRMRSIGKKKCHAKKHSICIYPEDCCSHRCLYQQMVVENQGWMFAFLFWRVLTEVSQFGDEIATHIQSWSQKKASKLLSSPHLVCCPCEQSTAHRHRAQADGHVVLPWKEILPLHSKKAMICFKV